LIGPIGEGRVHAELVIRVDPGGDLFRLGVPCFSQKTLFARLPRTPLVRNLLQANESGSDSREQDQPVADR